jgi:hypothetical protein
VRRIDANGFSLWPTPPESDSSAAGNRKPSRSGTHQGMSLTDATCRNWATPSARDHKGIDKPHRQGGASLPHQVTTGQMTHGGQRGQERHSMTGNSRACSSVVLSPAWVSQLQGFPWDWCDIGDVPLPRSGTRSSRKAPIS